MKKQSSLRYGENPHQSAAFYVDDAIADAGKGGIATAIQHHGKEVCPSFLVPSADMSILDLKCRSGEFHRSRSSYEAIEFASLNDNYLRESEHKRMIALVQQTELTEKRGAR